MHPAWYVAIGFVIFMIFNIRYGIKLRKSKRNIYKDFVHKYHLTSHKGDVAHKSVHITGKIRDFEFEMIEKSVSDSVWTYLTFKNSPIDFDFEILCETWLMSVTKSFGFNDVEVGEAEFDEKFVCNSKEEEKMKRFMDTFLQMELLNLYDDFFGMLENKTAEKTFEYVHQG